MRLVNRMKPLTAIFMVISLPIVLLAWTLMLLGSVLQGICAATVECLERADFYIVSSCQWLGRRLE